MRRLGLSRDKASIPILPFGEGVAARFLKPSRQIRSRLKDNLSASPGWNFRKGHPKRTIELFSRRPSQGVGTGCNLSPDDINVTAQIVHVIREGQRKTDMAHGVLNAV